MMAPILMGVLILAMMPQTVLAVSAIPEQPSSDGIGSPVSSESGFSISQWTGNTWEEVYQQQFQAQYSTEEFTFNAVDEEISLRIMQKDMPFADIDQVKLVACGQDLIPEYARYTADSQNVLDDILEIDYDVVLAHEQEMEISWEVPDGCDNATLFLTANEYGHSYPLRFPINEYVAYEMGSNSGSIVVDGSINETDGTTPLHSPFWQPATGHPDGYTYIYVCDDSENVYFSLDITPDNTQEYGEDWAEITILTSEGTEHVFRIDDFDDSWGKTAFGRTSKVSYKHQTCEFSIPKAIIGTNNIDFKLRYYGTAGAPSVSLSKTVDNSSLPDPGGDFTFTLTITNNTNYGCDIDNVVDTQSTDSTDFATNCALVGTYLQPAGMPVDTATCSYTVSHTEVGSYPNTATVNVSNFDGGGNDNDTITVTVTAREDLDYGDAMDSYGTLLASNGARHIIVQGHSLGPIIDAEPDAQPTVTCPQLLYHPQC
jgi:hypothetical protein